MLGRTGGRIFPFSSLQPSLLVLRHFRSLLRKCVAPRRDPTRASLFPSFSALSPAGARRAAGTASGRCRPSGRKAAAGATYEGSGGRRRGTPPVEDTARGPGHSSSGGDQSVVLRRREGCVFRGVQREGRGGLGKGISHGFSVSPTCEDGGKECCSYLSLRGRCRSLHPV